MTKETYHKGKAIQNLGNGYWTFEVEGKVYSNLLKTCLDAPCKSEIKPGFEFEISDMALSVSDLVEI